MLIQGLHRSFTVNVQGKYGPWRYSMKSDKEYDIFCPLLEQVCYSYFI